MQTLPKTFALEAGTIILEQDASTTLAFLQGFQVGHLAYMVQMRKQKILDTTAILVMNQYSQDRKHSIFYNAGLLLGWCSTLSQKTQDTLPITITQSDFHKGYQDGEHACLLRRKGRNHQTLALSELCALVSWSHGPNSASSAGYIIGYINALTVPNRLSSAEKAHIRTREEVANEQTI